MVERGCSNQTTEAMESLTFTTIPTAFFFIFYSVSSCLCERPRNLGGWLSRRHQGTEECECLGGDCLFSQSFGGAKGDDLVQQLV
ncbi:hypothetical protein Mal65_19540 [Crateriforma conspicua]|nr:hypothetical protein Mal65_19540 [Crateriforma conspicua]